MSCFPFRCVGCLRASLSLRFVLLVAFFSLLLVTSATLSSVWCEREGLGVGEEVSYLVVGVDGYFVDGNLTYFRVGDFVSVRGVVGSSSASVVGAPVVLRIFDPSGGVWFEAWGRVERGVEGLREFYDASGVHRSPWRAEYGFLFSRVKQVSEGDLEGRYVVLVSVANSVNGSASFYVRSVPRVEAQQSVSYPLTATAACVAVAAAVAVLAAVLVLRRRG